jgi:hypothetical protein
MAACEDCGGSCRPLVTLCLYDPFALPAVTFQFPFSDISLFFPYFNNCQHCVFSQLPVLGFVIDSVLGVTHVTQGAFPWESTHGLLCDLLIFPYSTRTVPGALPASIAGLTTIVTRAQLLLER